MLSVKDFDEILSTYTEAADNYMQTENMDKIHPESNKSAKESDKSLSDMK